MSRRVVAKEERLGVPGVVDGNGYISDNTDKCKPMGTVVENLFRITSTLSRVEDLSDNILNSISNGLSGVASSATCGSDKESRTLDSYLSDINNRLEDIECTLKNITDTVDTKLGDIKLS